VDPQRRYTLEKIKNHRWMSSPVLTHLGDCPFWPPMPVDPSDQILKLMQSLGIDAGKTRDVDSINSSLQVF